mgnify:FL=1|tara:strand:- start:217 stop:459 length:243 start_codon:yes stop_codon:yes gene_type:complete
MLVIVNISPEDTPNQGVNQYEVRVNDNVLATFEHERKPNGAAQCLRDAADAIDKAHSDRVDRITAKILEATEAGGLNFTY